MHIVELDGLTRGSARESYAPVLHLASRDPAEVSPFLQRHLGRLFCDRQGRTKPFLAAMRVRTLPYLTLSYVWCDPAMVIDSMPYEPNYCLFFRLFGSSEYRLPFQTFSTSSSVGALLPGRQHLQVRTQENWHVFGTRFPSSAMQAELSRILRRPITRPIEFDPKIDFNRGAGRSLKRMLLRLHKEAYRPEFNLRDFGLGVEHIEKSLIDLLLEGLRHNYSKLVNGPARLISPWQVRTVEEFVLENADQPLSLGDLTTVSGVSARSLQYAFRRHKGVSPMEFLRSVRLERVRDDLLDPNLKTTVTSVAMRWGFLHLSRFAEEYRIRFKENPSETLRRSIARRE